MTFPITPEDCNFQQTMLEQFAVPDSSIATSAVDTALLNLNTMILNEEINRFDRERMELIRKRPFSARVRKEFRNRIPESLYVTYDRAILTTVNDVVAFVERNRFEFGVMFPTPRTIIVELSEFDPGQINPIEVQFPSLGERLRSGPITSAEVDQLIRSNGIDPNRFGNQARTNTNSILTLLNKLLSNLGIGLQMMGSLCSLIENIYGIVAGQRNTFGNVAASAGDFAQIASSISPRLGEITEQIGQVTELVQTVQQLATSMRTNSQDAFQQLANALGMIMSFFDQETGTPGGVQIEWNYESIKTAIQEAIDDIEPGKEKFLTTLLNDKPLGDINQDGIIDSADIDALTLYIAGTQTNQAIVDYIEKKMTAYMVVNIVNYKDYTSVASLSGGQGDVSSAVSAFSEAASIFGSPSSPSSGDFGLSEIGNILTTIQGISSAVQSIAGQLRGGGAQVPLNIDSILSQLSTLRGMADSVSQGMFGDLANVAQRFQTSAEEALAVAEQVAVTDPNRTREIQEGRQTAVGDNITEVSNLIGQATNMIIPSFNREISRLQALIGNVAATGVLESIESRMTGAVDQSAQQLQATLSTMTPESLDNGFNFNMTSAFGRFASIFAQAQEATTRESTEHMHNVIRGQLAESSSRFRERNREEVEFVALRFCNMASDIERMYNGFADPLRGMVEQLQSASQPMTAAGNEVTTNAIRAGAIRLPSSARPAFAQQAATVPATVAGSYTGPNGQRTTVPPAGATPHIPYGPPADASGTYANLPTYEQVSRGGGLIRFNGLRSGWVGVNRDALTRLVSLSLRWNRTINISPNGAYVPRTVRDGRQDTSQHRVGKAFDISMPNRQDQLAFANLAHQVGFRGIGSYNSFIHIDTGGRRDWVATRNGGFYPGYFHYYSLPGPDGAKVFR
jgi:hypothetical protein